MISTPSDMRLIVEFEVRLHSAIFSTRNSSSRNLRFILAIFELSLNPL